VSDRIEVRDLRVTGTHGVLPEERDRAQPFSVDIVAWVDMEAAQQSDDLADTVDYGALAQAAADVVAGRSYRLLEALGGRLASALLIAVAGLHRAGVEPGRPARPAAPGGRRAGRAG
jgi:dihydroneopterin aldolase